MTDQFEERSHSSTLEEFRDGLGEEFDRVARAETGATQVRNASPTARPPRRFRVRTVVIAGVASLVVGAGVAVAATSDYPQTVTVTTPNGDTHEDVVRGVLERGDNGVPVLQEGSVPGCTVGEPCPPPDQTTTGQTTTGQTSP